MVLVLCTWGFGLAAFTASVLTMKPEHPGETTDAIVVLTGGKNRVETGLLLFSQKAAPQLFITGVHKDVTPQEIMAKHDGPLPECCLTLGYEATSTRMNAAETKEWIAKTGFKTIRVVTSNYHMPRALLELRRSLPGVTIIPNPIIQPDISPHHEYFWRLMAIEYHKTIFRFFDMIFEAAR